MGMSATSLSAGRFFAGQDSFSIEARTFRLWEALLFLQKIIDREKPPSPAAETLQILKWACLLHDVVTGSYCPDLDQGSDGWLDFLGVTCPV